MLSCWRQLQHHALLACPPNKCPFSLLRHSKSASKGAQYILYRSRSYDTVQQAVADCDVSIAFTRVGSC